MYFEGSERSRESHRMVSEPSECYLVASNTIYTLLDSITSYGFRIKKVARKTNNFSGHLFGVSGGKVK